MNGLQATPAPRELPVDQLSSPEAAAREETERNAAMALEADRRESEQVRSDAELSELWAQLKAIPSLLLARYPGAAALQDIQPADRARLAGALRKHLARFRENIERDS